MAIHSKFEELKASGHLPSPKGAALQVIQLTHKDDVTNQEIARAIKSDPALSSRVIKMANALVAYQTRPIVSMVDAVTVLGLNTVRQLVLGLSLVDGSRNGVCQKFDYQGFWARSLLTAIAAQNLVLSSGIGSPEEVFILGLLGQIGSLALATAYPQEYARILGKTEAQVDANLANLERAEFGFDHNQLTQAMLADWGMPRVFQEVALHHEDTFQSGFAEGSRDWRLADSSSKCNSQRWLGVAHLHPEQYFMWRSSPQHFAWTVIKSLYRALHLLVSDISQVHPLWKVLPD